MPPHQAGQQERGGTDDEHRPKPAAPVEVPGKEVHREQCDGERVGLEPREDDEQREAGLTDDERKEVSRARATLRQHGLLDE